MLSFWQGGRGGMYNQEVVKKKVDHIPLTGVCDFSFFLNPTLSFSLSLSFFFFTFILLNYLVLSKHSQDILALIY